LSEPPGIEVQVDGRLIGKTPIFSARFPPGAHVLRIKDSETDIRLAAGKTFAISWFKGSFIEIPETVKPPAEIAKEPQPAPAKSKPNEEPSVQQNTAKDPYYWPLNPRGPIYLGIPGEAGHRFRSKAATDSDRFRPPIPTQGGHPVLTHSRS
jgi:hypothetical protein